MRRTFDVFLVIMSAVATVPTVALVAILVFLRMGRPILFVQERSGKNGIPFAMVKFRSMTNARDSEGHLLSDAERLTTFGRLLRRSRLDELPELWNVLRGDMALIGPRPLLPRTIEGLGMRGRVRCSERPGLTGWAQISGNTALSESEKLDLDLWYIRHRNWKSDCKVILLTALVVVFGEHLNHDRLAQARQADSHN